MYNSCTNYRTSTEKKFFIYRIWWKCYFCIVNQTFQLILCVCVCMGGGGYNIIISFDAGKLNTFFIKSSLIKLHFSDRKTQYCSILILLMNGILIVLMNGWWYTIEENQNRFPKLPEEPQWNQWWLYLFLAA